MAESEIHAEIEVFLGLLSADPMIETWRPRKCALSKTRLDVTKVLWSHLAMQMRVGLQNQRPQFTHR